MSSSIIPYYDIIYEHLSKSDALLLSKITKRQHNAIFTAITESGLEEPINKSHTPTTLDVTTSFKKKPVYVPTLANKSGILSFHQFAEVFI